jgi:acetate kinase
LKILVINSGSSSLKFQLFNMENEKVLAQGLFQRIGIDNSYLEYKNKEKEIKIEKEIPDHNTAAKILIDTLLSKKYGVLKSMAEVEAVGHRLVHGGEEYTEAVTIDQEILKQIEKTSELAPLHIPPNIAGIKICQKLMLDKPQIGVLLLLFIRQCQKKHIFMLFPINIIKTIKFENMVFMVHHTNT